MGRPPEGVSLSFEEAVAGYVAAAADYPEDHPHRIHAEKLRLEADRRTLGSLIFMGG